MAQAAERAGLRLRLKCNVTACLRLHTSVGSFMELKCSSSQVSLESGSSSLEVRLRKANILTHTSLASGPRPLLPLGT